jgi:hypothetical protein
MSEPPRTTERQTSAKRPAGTGFIAVLVGVVAIVGLVVGFAVGRSTAPTESTVVTSQESSSAVTGESPSDEATIPEPSPSLASGSLSVGETGEDAGLKFKLTEVDEVDSLPVKDDYFGAPSSLSPKHGGKLIAAAFAFTNDGTKSVDIWCAFDLGARLIDNQNRQYDPVDDLYLVQGNTDCNEQIQPGFKTTETVVFEVPKSSGPVEIEFWNPNDGQDYFGEATAVTFAVS